MNARALKVLEFSKILSRLSSHAKTPVGKEACLQIMPENTLERASRLQAETAEGVTVLYRAGCPVSNFDDPRPAVARAQKGASLSFGELLTVARFLRASRTVWQKLREMEFAPLLAEKSLLLAFDRALEEEIFQCILSDEEISDSASPALYALRRKIRAAQDRVKEKIAQLLRENAASLQEQVITLRNDRYVLPVKSEAKGRVKGIVHDQSASGATLFIEPMAVVEINNDLRIYRAEEAEEIERILAAFSARIAPLGAALFQNADILYELDIIFARAQYALSEKAEQPVLNEKGYVNIKEGRHPLLDQKTAVPVTVELGGRFSVLLVTGPNTGGKTVTLKTIGLFTLMALSGLFLPVAQAEIAVFDNVFADIGDEQSIEQSLSTFSSHMVNIIGILESATKKSLVLLDELGAGTDPGEGSALAISVLEDLRLRGCRIAATTHYTELKAYSMETPGVENASVEFDVATLRPTYKLLVGVPGASNALLIAGRLGMPEEIITGARTRLSGRYAALEEALNKADALFKEAAAQKESAESSRRQAESKLRDAEIYAARWASSENEIVARAEKKAAELLHRAEEKAANVIDQINSLAKDASTKEIIEMQTLRNSLRAGKEQQKKTPPRPAGGTESIEKGACVEVLSMGQRAEVLEVNRDKKEAFVCVGSLRMNVKLADLRLVPNAAKKKTVGRAHVPVRPAVSASLDIRGKLVEEGIMELEQYLDAARISGLSEVTVIHGKGTGALRAGIIAYMRSAGLTHRPGKYGEGDAGVTIVEL